MVRTEVRRAGVEKKGWDFEETFVVSCNAQSGQHLLGGVEPRVIY